MCSSRGSLWIAQWLHDSGHLRLQHGGGMISVILCLAVLLKASLRGIFILLILSLQRHGGHGEECANSGAVTCLETSYDCCRLHCTGCFRVLECSHLVSCACTSSQHC